MFAKTTAGLIGLNLSILMLSGCGGDSNSSSNSGDSQSQSRFVAANATAANGGGELLVDTTANLTWINGAAIDTNRDGCISPANVGSFEPTSAAQYCIDQTYGGFNDWRVPTTAELSTLLKEAEKSNTQVNYLNAACPALVSDSAILRTANANTSVGNIATGDTIATTLAELPSGVNAGLRCVRDGVESAPPSTRFEFARASAADRGGRTLIDSNTSLQWINQTTLDASSDGCVSPANVGPTEPSEANSRCTSQNFAGFTDWRAPTSAELAEIITSTAATNGVALKYIVSACPALVATDGIVRTENANSAVGSTAAGGSLGSALADLPSGVNAGVRCVRSVTSSSM